MALFIGKSLYIILIGAISHLLILPVTASPQFGTDFTLPAPLGGDTTIQQDATPPQPNPTTPDALPPPLADDAQWSSSQTQNPDLLAQAQPQSLDNLNTDDTFDLSSLIDLNPAEDDAQTTNSQSNLASTSCSTNTNLKPGASRLLRRAYGEAQPCCDPVNLGLDNPWNWALGQNHIENRSPYCCQSKPYEYARQLLCVPCMYMYNPFLALTLIPTPIKGFLFLFYF